MYMQHFAEGCMILSFHYFIQENRIEVHYKCNMVICLQTPMHNIERKIQDSQETFAFISTAAIETI